MVPYVMPSLIKRSCHNRRAYEAGRKSGDVITSVARGREFSRSPVEDRVEGIDGAPLATQHLARMAKNASDITLAVQSDGDEPQPTHL